MHFLKTMLIGAAMATMTVAQGTLGFTSTPASVTAGKPVTITYSSPDSAPATITLRKGDPNNLKTISTLTTSATGGSYTWTPDASLADGSDYALQITQGINSINYSGQFSLSGGSASAVSSASATSSASMASASASSAIASLNGTVSSIIASLNSSMPTTTMGGTAVSAGTGTAMSRNTTMSIATLTSTDGSAASSTAGSGSSPSGASGSGAGASSTATSAPKNNAAGFAGPLASPLAFVLSAFAAIIYLN